VGLALASPADLTGTGAHMDLPGIVQSIQDSGVAEWMRTSIKAMPIVEAIHVLAAATVFGSIFIVDLRLLGFPNTRRPFTLVSHEVLRLTWIAFVVAVIAGALMFAANANTYYGNTAFRFKMLALFAAGVNMAIFQGITFRSVGAWDKDVPTPLAARVAGAASIVIWITVIFLARWIGFTKGYNFDVPDNVELDFKF
jgi:tryptophan-rich sensory protein